MHLSDFALDVLTAISLALLGSMVGLLMGLMKQKPGPSHEVPTAHLGRRLRRPWHPGISAVLGFVITFVLVLAGKTMFR